MKETRTFTAYTALTAGRAVGAGVGRVGGRSTGQTLGDQGMESQRDLSLWGSGRRADTNAGEVALLRARQLIKERSGGRVAGRDSRRVIGGARPLGFSLEHARRGS